MNNLKVITVTSDEYSKCFGFTFGTSKDICHYNLWNFLDKIVKNGCIINMIVLYCEA